MKWRVGRTVPVNIYCDDRIAGQCQTPEFATALVAGMNAQPIVLDLLDRIQPHLRHIPDVTHTEIEALRAKLQADASAVADRAEVKR